MENCSEFQETQNIKKLPSAEDQYRDIFNCLDEIISQINKLVHEKPIPDDQSYWGNVRMGLIIRAFNQYRSIVNLLRTNHWEDALILTRSLFELLLYTEELLRKPDLEKGAERFYLFSGLQGYLEFRELTLYNVLTGRLGQEVEDRIKNKWDKKARETFSTFWYKNKKGRGKWRESWCNKNRAELSRASKNPLRIHQYHLIYGRGSDFTHSSPIAVFAASHFMPPGYELKDLIGRSDSVEEQELKTVGPLASTFFLEILLLVGDRLPDFDHNWIAKTLETLKKMV